VVEDRCLRSKKLRSVLFRNSDGRCSSCGCELQSGWHADHKIPFKITQVTNVNDMQAMCPTCNLKKGASVFELREWQKKASKAVDRCESDFFVEATPGAGKTSFAAWTAKQKLTTGSVNVIIVVVPTLSLKEQWATALHANPFCIDAEHRYVGNGWPVGFQAIVITYQQMASDPANFNYLCHNRRVMVILDEIHHCGDDQTWGKAASDAFSHAAFRLCLSGTPFRSDNSSIPFLRYVDGKAIPDFVYGYGEGLSDGICRHLFFPRQGGRMEWATPQGNMRSKTFDDDLVEQESNQRLRTALTTGDWLVQTIKDATNVLSELREEDPDAGGLVIAMDISHANRIRKIFQDQIGIEPDCVSSDDPDAQTKLNNFKASKRPWIIAIKMVSEGVDIPRLRVGVYATNILTEMFFRQAVGRFVRVEASHEDHTASVFIPDDNRLRAFAEEIRQQRVHHLEQDIELTRSRSQDEDFEESDYSFFTPLNSSAEHKGTIVSDVTFTAAQLDIAATFSAGTCQKEIAAMILHRSGYFSEVEQVPVAAPTPRKTDVRKELRNTNNNIARAIAMETGNEFAHVNYDLNGRAGIRSIKDASVEQLERRLKVATEILQGAKRRAKKS